MQPADARSGMNHGRRPIQNETCALPSRHHGAAWALAPNSSVGEKSHVGCHSEGALLTDLRILAAQ